MRQDELPRVVPSNGFVPDEVTAVRIAEAIWLPIYSERVLRQKPFKATLKNGVWHVKGTLPAWARVGGTAIAEIAKADGRILRISHGK